MQHAYEEMKKNLPHIEFVKGIPDNLEHNDFFNTQCKQRDYIGRRHVRHK